MTGLILNADQTAALNDILKACAPGERHALTGSAGTGKTTLMQRLVVELKKRGKSVVLTAPTHKAVAVLARKLTEGKIKDVPCVTIHSLLSLKPRPYGDRLVFERDKRAEPVTSDVVVVDECSMLDSALMQHIRRYLPMAFVLFVGDPAQLPPVNEAESESFKIRSRSHLVTIVRQAAGNPILAAATAIRESQSGPIDWSWCKSANRPPLGVFCPRDSTDAWLKKAFTSPEFEEDPDTFRYLAWRNQRVAEVNEKVRAWRYGENIPTPFMPGERAMFRAPVIRDKKIIFNTNEEAKVLQINPSNVRHKFIECEGAASWQAELPAWAVTLQNADGAEETVHMPSDERALNRITDRVRDEADVARIRWKHLHDFKSSLARLQSIYALTCHNAQGSTMKAIFVDIGDIKLRMDSNPLECKQLLYTAVTRPSHTLMLVGV